MRVTIFLSAQAACVLGFFFLTGCGLWGRSTPEPTLERLEEAPAAVDSLFAVVSPPAAVVLPVPARAETHRWPASRDLRVEVSYVREDTAGFGIEPSLRVQAFYQFGQVSSDWYDLRCDVMRDDCDYWVSDGETAGAVHDTLTIRISRLLLSDPNMKAVWRFRFRLENQGKLSPWSEFGPVEFIGVDRTGVPRKPSVRVLP